MFLATSAQGATGGHAVTDPTTGVDFESIEFDTLESVAEAVTAANDAFVEWRMVSPWERGALLQAFATRLRAAASEISSIMVREGGKPVVEALFEVEATAATFDYYAGLARSRGGRIAPAMSPGSTSMVVREPIGVVGAILPWNFPLLLWAWKAAPALAAGNCVVAKPSMETPLSLRAAAALLELPDGVHSVVQGDGDVGRALTAHPGIGKIAFTGSTAVGKSILAVCAADARRCSVEMSGHDAAIVWDDVDLDTAVEAILFAAFSNAGQVCTSAERIYVRDTIFDEFRDRLIARVRALTIGDPGEMTTQVGPLVSLAHRERVAKWIEKARAAGAVIHVGGHPVEGPGAYFEPTVLTGLSHEALNGLGEIFGPIAPLVPISTFQEGIDRANDNRFGLSANVLVANLGLAMKAARELRVGTVWINNPLVDNLAAPFGGFREAGIGRELGEEGFDAYTEAKHVWIEAELTEQYYWYRTRGEYLHLLGQGNP